MDRNATTAADQTLIDNTTATITDLLNSQPNAAIVADFEPTENILSIYVGGRELVFQLVDVKMDDLVG